MMAGLLAIATTATLALTGCGGGDEGGFEGGNKSGNDVVITFAGWGSLAEKQNFTPIFDSK